MNIYAQIFGTIAVLLMFTSYLKTSKKEYLLYQTLCNVFYTIQYYLVGGISGAGVCIITMIKSMVFYLYDNKGKNIPVYILLIFEFVVIMFGISVYTDVNSILPIIISCLFTYGTWQKNLKITYCIGTFAAILWVIYNLIIGAYVSIIGNIFEFVASIIGIYRISKVIDVKSIKS